MFGLTAAKGRCDKARFISASSQSFASASTLMAAREGGGHCNKGLVAAEVMIKVDYRGYDQRYPSGKCVGGNCLAHITAMALKGHGLQ